MESIYKFLASKTLALYSFCVLVAILIPKSLIREKFILLDWSIKVVLILLFLNLLICTIRRFKSLSKAVLLIHSGCLITMAGALASSLGYVATVNIHEGDSTDTFFRWDIEQDAPLGFTLALEQINAEFYPVGIKIGVLRGEEKLDLFVLQTGESFVLEDFTVQAGDFNFSSQSVSLDIYNADATLLGSSDTLGNTAMPPDFPYSFKLVAFQDPVTKRVWTDINLSQNNEVIAGGTAEVNHPFLWNGLRFYNTLTDRDEQGRPYAGIQIVNDPGIPLVYAGVSILCLGALLSLLNLLQRKQR